MTAYDILAPLGLIILGVVLALFSQQAGVAFCRFGKAIWKVSTLGLTDMHWFYSEEKAPRTMKVMGIVLCFIGAVVALLSYVSLHGPNSLAAMRQADDYLIGVYGRTDGDTSFTCTTSDTSEMRVRYEYGDRHGNLRASWDGQKYNFSQEP